MVRFFLLNFLTERVSKKCIFAAIIKIDEEYEKKNIYPLADDGGCGC